MPEITKISTQKRTTERFNIYLDGKFSFSLSDEVLLAQGLRQGDKISDEKISEILESDLQSKILSKILDFISYQPRSEREVKDKLDLHLLKLVPNEKLKEELKEKIFKRIIDLGVVNDAEFAKLYISGKMASKNPPGKFKLKQFLFQKGISRDIIDNVLEGYGSSAETEGAMAAADKKLKVMKAGTTSEKMGKLWKFLASRGYSSDVIKAVVDTKLGTR